MCHGIGDCPLILRFGRVHSRLLVQAMHFFHLRKNIHNGSRIAQKAVNKDQSHLRKMLLEGAYLRRAARPSATLVGAVRPEHVLSGRARNV